MSEVGDAIRKLYDTDPDRDVYEGIALQVDDLWERVQRARRRSIAVMEDHGTVHIDAYDTAGPLLPHRGDAVADWLKARRDEEGRQNDVVRGAIDDLLDEYRLRADLGLTLTDEIEDNR